MFPRTLKAMSVPLGTATALFAGSRFFSVAASESTSIAPNSAEVSRLVEQFKAKITSKDLVADSTPNTPTRAETLDRLKNEEFDVLVIGGGVVGAGAALEASSRGLKVALVERGDFASGTSSRSTKLIHGGVRYLEQAIFELDFGLLKLVAEALRERGHMIRSASYMNHSVPIIIPIYRWWEVPYMWMGCKMYDVIAMSDGAVPSSYYIPVSEVKEKFPNLKTDGVCGALVYFDGQMNDARHTATLAFTAEAKHGAAIANYVTVDGLTRDDVTGEMVNGAQVHDTVTNTKFNIKARSVINATGVFSDKIRQMDNPSAPELIVPSDGVHITLPGSIFPKDMGMLIPKTSDGRVLFCLPWEGGVIAGTTDGLSEVSDFPIANKSDVEFIKANLEAYLSVPIKDEDIRSVWCGTRPLVKNPKYVGTSKISREHVVLTSESGLVSVMGGKYTTYRQMAEDAVNALFASPKPVNSLAQVLSSPDEAKNLQRATVSVTRNTPILGMDLSGALGGGDGTTASLAILKEAYRFPTDVSEHLVRNYGVRSLEIADLVCKMNSDTQNPTSIDAQRLTPGLPFLAAEVQFAAMKEKALTTEDVLFRRTRLGFVDQHLIKDTVQKASDILAQQLKWTPSQKQDNIAKALKTAQLMSLEAVKTEKK